MPSLTFSCKVAGSLCLVASQVFNLNAIFHLFVLGYWLPILASVSCHLSECHFLPLRARVLVLCALYHLYFLDVFNSSMFNKLPE